MSSENTATELSPVEEPTAGESAGSSYALLPPTDTAFAIGQWPVTIRQAELATVLVLTLMAGFLLFKNLGDQCLWQDEAQTALLSKTILTDGYPRGYDGKNYLSQEYGIEYWGKNLVYRWHTWLSFYLVAGSFAIFGPTTFAARLPFALFGLATVPLTYYFARAIWQSRRAAALAAFLLTVNVPFLILSRQCRYYSACAFLMLLGLWAYDRMMRRQRHAALWFVLAAVLLFHAFYVYWGMLLAAVGIHALIFHRDRFWAVVRWSLVTLLLVTPWLVWYFWPPAAVYTDPVKRMPYAALTFLYSAKLCEHVFSPIVFATLLITMAAVGQVRKTVWGTPFTIPDIVALRGTMFVLLVTVIGIATLVIATPHYFFRYMAPLVPLVCILAGRIFEAAFRLRFGLGAIALALVLLTSPMNKYFYEITHHLRTPSEAICRFLNAHAKPDDVVAISYGDMPVKFYTGLRVVGGMTGEDLIPADTARWVIVRRRTFATKQRHLTVPQYLLKMLEDPANNYRTYELDFPDDVFDNRECPDVHRYQSLDVDPEHEKDILGPILVNERLPSQPKKKPQP